MNPTQKLVVIDGCALPLDLYNQARQQAIATRATQLIGVLYDAPATRPPAPPADALDMVRFILSPSPFFADLRAGAHCRYLIGCTHAELRSCNCAMILYVTRFAEKVTA